MDGAKERGSEPDDKKFEALTSLLDREKDADVKGALDSLSGRVEDGQKLGQNLREVCDKLEAMGEWAATVE
jgi:hypothetical protein